MVQSMRALVVTLKCPVAVGALVAAVAVGVAPPCWANGAFPDALSVLAPPGRPHLLTVATNFGLLTSLDDGGSWQWSCEERLTDYGRPYQLGAPPGSRLFAVSTAGVVYSDDDSCHWTAADLPVRDALVSDTFPDPTNPQRVLAILQPRTDGGLGAETLLQSDDGGKTFDVPRYQAAVGESLTGVEVARSDPRIVYLTTYRTAGAGAFLLTSTDGAATWSQRPITDGIGFIRGVRLIAVDPLDPGKVFLRVSGDSRPPPGGADAADEADIPGERLVVATDGGAVVSAPLVMSGGKLTSFSIMNDGTIVVAGLMGAAAVAWRSMDGGRGFLPLPQPPHIRALTARGQLLFAATGAGEGDAAAAPSDARSSRTGEGVGRAGCGCAAIPGSGGDATAALLIGTALLSLARARRR